MIALEFVSEMEMSHPESLVIRAWRKLAFGRGGCRLLGREFGPSDGFDVIEAIAMFLKELSQGSRHMLTVGHPGCANITSDERQMLAVIAASQADDAALLLSHLSWLVKHDHREAVAETAQALGRLLTQRGMDFPLPAPRTSSVHPILTVVRGNAIAP